MFVDASGKAITPFTTPDHGPPWWKCQNELGSPVPLGVKSYSLHGESEQTPGCPPRYELRIRFYHDTAHPRYSPGDLIALSFPESASTKSYHCVFGTIASLSLEVDVNAMTTVDMEIHLKTGPTLLLDQRSEIVAHQSAF